MKDIIKSALEMNICESETKACLIEPILSYLQYDVSNFMIFRREYPILEYDKSEAVDYAVIIDGQPQIIIEAKRVKEDLDKHKGQLRRYFNSHHSIKYAILTNGRQYMLFSDIDNDNIMDPEPIVIVNLEDDDHELHLLSKKNIMSKREYFKDRANQQKAHLIIDKNEEIIENIHEDIKKILSKHLTFDEKYIRNKLVSALLEKMYFSGEVVSALHIPFMEKLEVINTNQKEYNYNFASPDHFTGVGKKPLKLIYKNIACSVTRYQEVLEAILNSLPEGSEYNLLQVNEHYKSKKHLLVTDDYLNLSDSNQNKHIEYNGVYIGYNLSGKDMIRLCKVILDVCDVDPQEYTFVYSL